MASLPRPKTGNGTTKGAILGSLWYFPLPLPFPTPRIRQTTLIPSPQRGEGINITPIQPVCPGRVGIRRSPDPPPVRVEPRRDGFHSSFGFPLQPFAASPQDPMADSRARPASPKPVEKPRRAVASFFLVSPSLKNTGCQRRAVPMCSPEHHVVFFDFRTLGCRSGLV